MSNKNCGCNTENSAKKIFLRKKQMAEELKEKKEKIEKFYKKRFL